MVVALALSRILAVEDPRLCAADRAHGRARCPGGMPGMSSDAPRLEVLRLLRADGLEDLRRRPQAAPAARRRSPRKTRARRQALRTSAPPAGAMRRERFSTTSERGAGGMELQQSDCCGLRRSSAPSCRSGLSSHESQTCSTPIVAERLFAVHEPAQMIVVLMGADHHVDRRAVQLLGDGRRDLVEAGHGDAAVPERPAVDQHPARRPAPAVNVTRKQSPSSCRRYMQIFAETLTLMISCRAAG